jgi:hypothetical protein
MVVEAKWRFTEPTQIGGRSSNIKATNLLTSKTKSVLMLMEIKIKKLNQLLPIRVIMEETRNGKLFILKMLRRLIPRD